MQPPYLLQSAMRLSLEHVLLQHERRPVLRLTGIPDKHMKRSGLAHIVHVDIMKAQHLLRDLKADLALLARLEADFAKAPQLPYRRATLPFTSARYICTTSLPLTVPVFFTVTVTRSLSVRLICCALSCTGPIANVV